MKGSEVDHGRFGQLNFKFTVKDLARYTKSLKPGQTVYVKKIVDLEGGGTRTSVNRATVVEVYPHITVVDQPAVVKNCGKEKAVIRRTSYTNKELMIWNANEEGVCRE